MLFRSYAVDLALNLGGKIVWFPTISSHAHLDHLEEGGTFPNATITLRQPRPLSILDEDGAVKPEVDGLIEGAVDLHVHPFPSPFPRRMGIVEATKDAARAKYRARSRSSPRPARARRLR